jgi:hypothetical protein
MSRVAKRLDDRHIKVFISRQAHVQDFAGV